MNIFHKVAFQGLKKNKTRTLVTIAGVVLSAALVTAGVTFGVSLLDYMVRGAQEKAGSWARVRFSTPERSRSGRRTCQASRPPRKRQKRAARKRLYLVVISPPP